MKNAPTKVQSFLHNQGFDENAHFQLITNSASQRLYGRISEQNKKYIITYSENVEENATFLYFTEKFGTCEINTPKILAISEDQTIYIQEDLGEKDLLSHIQNPTDKLPNYLSKVISDLVKIQVELPKVIDFSRAYEFQQFDEKLILNDLFYFKNYFLEYLEIPFKKQVLIEEFYSISQKAMNLPNDFFLYRDFQSRNIMIKNEEPYYIDYQGGMRGIAAYDCVSFSWQAKANFSPSQKEAFKQNYFQAMQETGTIDLAQLEQSYQLSLIIRLYQLLGAYGFRGLVQQKPHFKESITQTLVNVQYLVENNFLNDYPELENLSKKYLTPENISL